ncbi:MAG TPA: hypothetical protein VD866_16460 [Urbifossiella sp.]|nr:hypothetical protein [Urbifossiella sp.]
MLEFVVTLRTGKRYVVRADRVSLPDHDTLSLIVEPAPAIGGPGDTAVAVFDRRIVTSVIAADHLVSEADEPEVVSIDPDADIPF